MKAHGLSHRTALNWTKKIRDNIDFIPPNLRRGGPHDNLLQPQHINHLIEYIEENPNSTLMEIRLDLQSTFPSLREKRLSCTTIFNHLDNQLLTRKRIRYIAPNRNTMENIDPRAQYAQRIIDLPENIHQVYIDETNFTLLTRRNYWRSHIGNNSTKVIQMNGCARLIVISAMDNQQGLVYKEKTTATVNSDKFLGFLTNLINKLHNENPDTSYVLIFDNARIHNREKITDKKSIFSIMAIIFSLHIHHF